MTACQTYAVLWHPSGLAVQLLAAGEDMAEFCDEQRLL